tara:strand:+ start:72 stop:500 length:429 start_codon:yes stop_codon:yes gene_type:complete
MFDAVIYELRIGNYYYIGSSKNMKTRQSQYKKNFGLVAENYDIITKDVKDFENVKEVKKAWITWRRDNAINVLNSKLACAFICELVYEIKEIDWISCEDLIEQRKTEQEHFAEYRERLGAENMLNGQDIICSYELYLSNGRF